MKTCLIAGHKGMLGSRLLSHIQAVSSGQWSAAGLDLPELDITSPGSVAAAFDSHSPDIVINCAAYTNVDGAETDEENAFRVNAVGPELLARAASASGALLVHLSTDFIFDGTKAGPYVEDDAPSPLSVYGKSKWVGEKAVVECASEHLVIRTAWLYGPGGKNFVDTILALARERGSIRVVNDQKGSPTFTGMLAEVLWKLATEGARGVFHVAGKGACTWYDLAARAVALAGVGAQVAPVTTEAFPRPAPRPANSVLDCSKAEAFLARAIDPWQTGLERHISERS